MIRVLGIREIGFERFLRNVKYRRHRYRQFIGIFFIFILTAAGVPGAGVFWVGAAFVLAGSVVRMWASGHIKKDTELAIDGPYAYVRHPLYVGNILLGIGYCFASGLWWSAPLLCAILILFYPQAIRHEDQKLHRLFKEDWEVWRKRTYALIPCFKASECSGGDWSFWQSLRQNGEPIIGAVLFACLYVLYQKL